MATIRKRGERWQVQVRRKGQPAASRSFLQKSDALLWARFMEAEADRRILPVDPKRLKRTTFSELLVRYRNQVAPGKRAGYNEVIFLNALLRHPIARRRLNELGPETFSDYRDTRLLHVKPASVLRELATIQHVLEVARRDWGVPLLSNPVANIRKPRPGKARDRRLSPEEAEALRHALARTRNRVLGPLFRFAVETGMRRGELLRMEWRHLDRARRTLLIPISKNGHARCIPLSSTALDILHEVEGLDRERVFPTTANAVRLAWTRLCRRAGIADLHFHDLRHEAISRFFELGLNTPEVALISGHRDPRMLFRYTHLRAEDVAKKLG